MSDNVSINNASHQISSVVLSEADIKSVGK